MRGQSAADVGGRERGRRGRRRDRRPLAGSAVGFSATTRGRGGRIPPRHGRSSRAAGGEERELPLPPASTGRACRRCSPRSPRRSRPARIPTGLDRAQPPAAARPLVVGRPLDDAELVDDGMAATPAKTAAALRGRVRTGSVVLVAGGELDERRPSRPRVARGAAPARGRLRGGASGRSPRRPLRPCGRTARAAARAHAGRRRATASSTPSRRRASALSGAEALLVSPMFPVSLDERERIAPAPARTRRTSRE